jgi:hypothetical protein
MNLAKYERRLSQLLIEGQIEKVEAVFEKLILRYGESYLTYV